IDGKLMPAELLSADRARGIYEEIVRKTKDPALLEYAGRDLLRVRIFPIEAHGTKRVKLVYSEVLTRDAGIARYTCPMGAMRFASGGAEKVSLNLKLKTAKPIKSLYSPSHELDVKRPGAREATV